METTVALPLLKQFIIWVLQKEAAPDASCNVSFFIFIENKFGLDQLQYCFLCQRHTQGNLN